MDGTEGTDMARWACRSDWPADFRFLFCKDSASDSLRLGVAWWSPGSIVGGGGGGGGGGMPIAGGGGGGGGGGGATDENNAGSGGGGGIGVAGMLP